jgi:hypothetical protein
MDHQRTENFRYLKGTVSRDFLLQIFFMNHLSRSPENNTKVITNFFQKFAEIFASQGAPPVSKGEKCDSYSDLLNWLSQSSVV